MQQSDAESDALWEGDGDEQANDWHGLSWRDVKGKKKRLKFSSAESTFPMRCLFTNEPVTELTEMNLHVIEPRTGMTGRTTVKEHLRTGALPIGAEWLAERIDKKKRIGRILIKVGWIGLALTGVGILLLQFLPEMNAFVEMSFVVAPMMLVVFGFSIGLAFPHLTDYRTDPHTLMVTFAGDPGVDEFLMDDVHPDYLSS